MSSENPNAFIEKMMEEIVEYGISGPGAAMRLFEAGLGLEDTEQALRSVGFEAFVDKKRVAIKVSVERFSGNVHPVVPPKYETKIVPLESGGHGWLSEVE